MVPLLPGCRSAAERSHPMIPLKAGAKFDAVGCVVAALQTVPPLTTPNAQEFNSLVGEANRTFSIHDLYPIPQLREVLFERFDSVRGAPGSAARYTLQELIEPEPELDQPMELECPFCFAMCDTRPRRRMSLFGLWKSWGCDHVELACGNFLHKKCFNKLRKQCTKTSEKLCCPGCKHPIIIGNFVARIQLPSDLKKNASLEFTQIFASPQSWTVRVPRSLSSGKIICAQLSSNAVVFPPVPAGDTLKVNLRRVGNRSFAARMTQHEQCFALLCGATKFSNVPIVVFKMLEVSPHGS